MYTGESIRFEDLMNDNLYDIDHIYPRHFVKDDSFRAESGAGKEGKKCT